LIAQIARGGSVKVCSKFLLLVCLSLAACSKSEIPPADHCRPVAAASGVRVYYTGPMGMSVPDFPLANYHYFGTVDSISSASLMVRWDHLSSKSKVSNGLVEFPEICEEDHRGNRVDYVGPRGTAELFFPDSNAQYLGTIQAQFKGNRFEVKWDHETESTMQPADTIQYRN